MRITMPVGHLRALGACVSTEEARPALGYVWFEPPATEDGNGHAVATNGHVMASMPLADAAGAVVDWTGCDPKGFGVSRADLPKSGKDGNVSMYFPPLLGGDGAWEDMRGFMELPNGRESVVYAKRLDYPSWRAVTASALGGVPVVRFGLSTGVLDIMAKAGKFLGGDGFHIHVNGEDRGAHWLHVATGMEFTVMPLRSGDVPIPLSEIAHRATIGHGCVVAKVA